MDLRVKDLGPIPDLDIYKLFDLEQASLFVCVNLGFFTCETEMLIISWREGSGWLGFAKWAPKAYLSNSHKPNLNNPGIIDLSYFCIIESTNIMPCNNELYAIFNMRLYFLHTPGWWVRSLQHGAAHFFFSCVSCCNNRHLVLDSWLPEDGTVNQVWLL